MMETLYAILMFLVFISDDKGVRDRVLNACDKPYVCKTAKPDTKACIKEAMKFQMENCLRR